MRDVIARWASSLADATRATAGEPTSALTGGLRLYLRRLAGPAVRLLDRVSSGDGTAMVAAIGSRHRRVAPLIRPATVIERETVESLVAGADDYFRHAIASGGDAFLKRKPFHDLAETPQTLFKVGQMLQGSHLAAGLHIVEYGAGTGWLSCALWQMGCRVTCVDASDAALAVARASCDERRRLIPEPVMPFETMVTDGRTLPLADESADRVMCHDAFHHIPNQAEVLGEFARVLRPGGIACFCEPGRQHSSTPASQDEMAHHRVLENDVVIEDIWQLAQRAGFSRLVVRPVLDVSYSVTLDDYLSIVKKGRAGLAAREALMNGTASNSIFFLHKGTFVLDSRSAAHLSGHLTATPASIRVSAGAEATLAVRCRNTGEAVWRSTASSPGALGVVNVGIQLCDEEGRVISRDWRRARLPRDVRPAESVDVECALAWAEPGRFGLRLDLVSEGVAWFGAAAVPELIDVTVV